MDKQFLTDIRKGKNLEQSIPQYITEMSSLYNESQLYNLAMNLSMILEKEEFAEQDMNTVNAELREKILSLVKSLVNEPFSPESNKKFIEQTVALREIVKHRMEAVTKTVDELVLYEYIINRLEPAFEQVEVEETSNDDLSREILRWIFETEDNGIINERIKTATSQLPMRFTKEKILDIIENTYEYYKCSDNKAIDMFDYMLRSASALYKVDDSYNVYSDLNEIIDELKNTDFDKLTSDRYYELKENIRLASNIVSDLSDDLTDLEGLINATLAVFLTKPYISLDAEKNTGRVYSMLQELLAYEADYETLFTGTEERVDELINLIADEESGLMVIEKHYAKECEQAMLAVPFQRLLMCQRLSGESTFADLITEENVVDDEYRIKVRDAFKKDLEDKLSSCNRSMKNAIYSRLIAELPVLFSSHTEVMEYVTNGINSIKDPKDRQIVMNLIRDCYD